MVKYMGTATSTSMEVNVEKLGAPGVRGSLMIIAVRKDEARRDMDRVEDTTERLFEVSTLLAKHPPATGDIKGDFTAADGTSYSRIVPGKDHLIVACPTGTFRIDKNGVGELSLISMELTARTSTEAKHKFLNSIGPTLDHLAYLGNIPILTSTLKVFDKTHDVQYLDYVSPYRPVVLGDFFGAVSTDMLPVYSMYREALNSGSVYYQLLCYYKIIEGLAKIKAKAMKRAKALGLQFELPDETVPYHEDLAADLRPYVGKSIKHFHEKVLTHRFRDSVAHFVLKENTVLHASAPAELAAFSAVVFACELCARALIRNHEALLVQLDQCRPAQPL